MSYWRAVLNGLQERLRQPRRAQRVDEGGKAMTGPDQPGLRLWDDNPSLIDLLGFDAVVNPILESIETPHLDPVTIGVQSP